MIEDPDNVIGKALAAVLLENAPIVECRYLKPDVLAVMRDDHCKRVFCGYEALPVFERLVERVRAAMVRQGIDDRVRYWEGLDIISPELRRRLGGQ